MKFTKNIERYSPTMTLVEYLVKKLIEYNVTDVFGVPGGSILDFLYEIEKNNPLITPRLSFHEQAAAFSALGYGQSNGELGVVYATRGPGITNTLTAVADAYYESVPLLVVTGHSFNGKKSIRRVDENQEIDTVSLFKAITKASVKLSDLQSASQLIDYCIELTVDGRKGPVLLDIKKSLFNCTINSLPEFNTKKNRCNSSDSLCEDKYKHILSELKISRRPVILIGDGIRQSSTNDMLTKITSKLQIPIISSRYSQDLQKNNPNYYGYLGSHGLRYTNFILSKTDLMLVFGNNLNFPDRSVTFKRIFSKTKVMRFDIDEKEFARNLENLENVKINLSTLFNCLLSMQFSFKAKEEWLQSCKELKEKLLSYDINEAVEKILYILNSLPRSTSIVSDVGNNEFWLCRAYALSNCDSRILFSKSFGAMGSSIPKAIGVYYRTLHPVISFNGDQAFQMNLQELQVISNLKLPVTIVVVNNSSSGMIKTRQTNFFSSKFLHTTIDSGYSNPSFAKIAFAYGFNYFLIDDFSENPLSSINYNSQNVIEIKVSEDIELFPSIKLGDDCQNMYPYLDKCLYQYLESI